MTVTVVTGVRERLAAPEYPADRLVAALLRRPPGALGPGDVDPVLLRDDPFLAYVAVRALFHAAGPASAAALADACRLDPAPLPEPWSEDLAFLRALARLAGGDGGRLRWEHGSVSLPLTPHRGVPTVGLVADGTAGRFAVDTGAPTTVVDESFARRAGLRVSAEGRRRVWDGSGHALEVRPGVVGSLACGSARAARVPVTVLRLPSALDLDGIVSPWDLARGSDVTFDGDQALVLTPGGSRASGGTLLHWVDGTPRIDVRLEDERGLRRALVDSGAATCLAAPSLVKAQDHVPVHAVGAGGVVDASEGGTLRVSAADGAWSSRARVVAKASVSDPTSPVDTAWEVVLGAPWIASFVVTFPADRASLVVGRR